MPTVFSSTSSGFFAKAARLSCVAGISAVGITATPLYASATTPSTHLTYLAEAPASYPQSLTDADNVLSEEEKTRITQTITDVEQELGARIVVVIAKNFDGTNPTVWSSQVLSKNGGTQSNTAVYALSMEERKFAVQVGENWRGGNVDSLYENSIAVLQNDATAVGASIDAFLTAARDTSTYTPSTETNTSANSGNSALWLGAGVGSIALVGGGAWAYSRSRRKETHQQNLEAGRAIAPHKTEELEQLPLETLHTLAEEELVSTDESIRNAKQELELAQAEFGAERIRTFTRAMNHSTMTLQKAFSLMGQINSGRIKDPIEKRSVLVEIVSTCGLADDALDKEAENFAQLRNVLINAPELLDTITQKTIEARARLSAARQTLDTLNQAYPAEILESIVHNPDLAQVSIEQAEKNLEMGKTLVAKPAGQQSGLVAAIRNAEEALAHADNSLSAIEHAQDNILLAKEQLPALKAEIDEEITEALHLREQGQQQGTAADWAELDAIVAAAQGALETVRNKKNDPLGSWTLLTDIDSRLDEQLDVLREQTSQHERQLRIFDQQAAAAQAAIQAANDFISTRGRVIGSRARTQLADAQQLFAQALQNRITHTRTATQQARQAAESAKSALRHARHDEDSYQRRNTGGGSGTSFLTGMVLGQILGGNSGGFGGGFGGGSGMGGSFGGGSGRSGSF
ncbi:MULTISPECIES: TPM domain-containing protein [unclassified Corynebacterium]|uniref:TPM domain-containing protein n=1 Tax=unclassified Corynebacterium TaxID=2624378 RepID=UPI00163D8957|nr:MULTISPECIES: TPM domain-containing protein [unclassified Corynebacterium]